MTRVKNKRKKKNGPHLLSFLFSFIEILFTPTSVLHNTLYVVVSFSHGIPLLFLLSPPLPACYNIRQFPFLVVVVVSLSYFYTLIRLLLCGFLSDSGDQKVMMNDQLSQLQLEGVKFPFLIPSFQMTTNGYTSGGVRVFDFRHVTQWPIP